MKLIKKKAKYLKIPIIGLSTKSTLKAAENKIPIVSSLVKKTGYNTKINEIEKKFSDLNHGKYFDAPEFAVEVLMQD